MASLILQRGIKALTGMAREVASFAFPQACPGCGVPADASRLLCDDCHSSIPRLSMPLCSRCLASGREPVGCLRHTDRTVWAAWVYDERAALVVRALKYAERPQLAKALGAELECAIPPGLRLDLILEVPLHPARHRERGYNQAALLADALSERNGTPRIEAALERIHATHPQARLEREARRENVAQAFRVRRPEWLKGRNVLIVDDVMTTGATLDACLGALAQAGARATGVALAWAQ